MSEIWRPVVGHEATYEVSDAGNVRSLDRKVAYKDGRVASFRGRSLVGSRGAEGYISVALDRGRRMNVHRLVATAFVANPEGHKTVNHKNGNKRDNRSLNLEWCDCAHNNRHAREAGLQSQHGENCNLTLYTDQFVAAMRRVHEHFGCSYRDLALLFDVSEAYAASVAKGLTRKR